MEPEPTTVTCPYTPTGLAALEDAARRENRTTAQIANGAAVLFDTISRAIHSPDEPNATSYIKNGKTLGYIVVFSPEQFQAFTSDGISADIISVEGTAP